MMMGKMNLSVVIFGILFLIFIDRCTVINILTSNVFRNPKYKAFPNLDEGGKSGQYEIVKLCDEYYPTVSYDPNYNVFLAYTEGNLIELDHNGIVKMNIVLKNQVEEKPSPYVVDSGVVDFSNEKMVKEKFHEILNSGYKLSFKEWYKVFNEYYSKAFIVVYNLFDDGKGQGHIYMKTNENWVLLYVNKNVDWNHRRYEGNGMVIDLEDMPKKDIPKDARGIYPEVRGYAFLLKDEKNKTYSNRLSTDGNAICDELQYPDYEKKTLFFNKEKVDETMSYIGFPSFWGGTAYYKLKKDDDVLNFKCYAAKFVFSFAVEANFYWLHIPKQYKEKSVVSFLDFKYPTSVDIENKSIGLYVVRQAR